MTPTPIFRLIFFFVPAVTLNTILSAPTSCHQTRVVGEAGFVTVPTTLFSLPASLLPFPASDQVLTVTFAEFTPEERRPITHIPCQ